MERYVPHRLVIERFGKGIAHGANFPGPRQKDEDVARCLAKRPLDNIRHSLCHGLIRVVPAVALLHRVGSDRAMK